MRLVSPVHNLADERGHFDADLLFVFTGHEFHELVGLMMGHQVDGGAADTAAGQARADDSGGFAGQFNQYVQLLGAVLAR